MITATAEVAYLMGITQCIMSAQTNRPMMGAVLDTVTGAFLLTSDKSVVTIDVAHDKVPIGINPATNLVEYETRDIPMEMMKQPAPVGVQRYVTNEVVHTPDGLPLMQELNIRPELFYDCLSYITSRDQLADLNERLDKYNVPHFSGRALFSALLPSDFYYKKSGKIGDDNNTVIIMNGVLVQGIITKDHIGGSHNSIIQVLWKDYRGDRTVEFMTDLPFIIDHWLVERGFSVGLQDCYPMDDTHKDMLRTEIAKTKINVEALGGKLDDPLEEERREKKIVGLVNNVKDIGYVISTQKLAPGNALNVMALSGAKGTTFNIAQITGLLGQQFFKGKRIKKQLAGGTRAMPYFEEGDEDITARGFIEHSFLEGLSPAEFYAHHIAGREGLMDTALKTAETGFIQRKMMETLRDISVQYDGSVRNTNGNIFQFAYGYDGFDAAELQMVHTSTGNIASFIDLAASADKINVKYGFAPAN